MKFIFNVIFIIKYDKMNGTFLEDLRFRRLQFGLLIELKGFMFVTFLLLTIFLI